VHAYGTPFDQAHRLQDEHDVRSKALESMDQLVEGIYDEPGFENVECDTVVVAGSPVKAVLEIADENKVDLIVMGTKGRSDLDNVIFGSTAAEVTLEADCPVLTVPDGIEFSDIEHLAYATDYREEDLPIIWNLIQIATYLDAGLHLLFVAEEESLVEELMFRGFRDLIREKFQYESVRYEMIQGKDFIKSIHGYAGKYEGIILAMGYYRSRFLNSMSHRDMVKQMAYHTRIPLLVMPELGDKIDLE